MKRKELPKPVIVLIVVALALAIPIMSGCRAAAPEVTPPEAEEVPTYHWRMQAVWMPAQVNDILRPWCDQLEEELAGRADVTIETYCIGELVPPEEMLPALQAGTLELVMGSGTDLAAPGSLITVGEVVPFGWNSGLEAITLFKTRGLEDLMRAAYEDLGGIHYLGPAPVDPFHLISSRPIRNYEDLAGLKIDGFEHLVAPLIDAGAESVKIPPEEIYLAGQTGMIEAIAWCGATEAYTNGWHEPFPYFLTQPLSGGAICNYLINKELWESLPADVQETINTSIEALQMRQLLYYYGSEPKYRDYFTLTTMPGEDWARVKANQEKYTDEWAAASPENKQYFEILTEFNNEMEAANWYR